MIFHIFTVRDAAVGAFARPMFLQSAGQALRSFANEVNRADPDNEMNRHPQDFSLYYLGTYDDSNASFLSYIPELKAQASDLIVKE